jgi:hypothetical protein
VWFSGFCTAQRTHVARMRGMSAILS